MALKTPLAWLQLKRETRLLANYIKLTQQTFFSILCYLAHVNSGICN